MKFILILIGLWSFLNVFGAIFSGLIFKPFGSFEKWAEHSLLLSGLFIGAGLFVFSAEKYGLRLKELLFLLVQDIRRNVSVALKYFIIFFILFVLVLGAFIGMFFVLNKFLPTPGDNSQLLQVGKDFLRFKALSFAAPGGKTAFLISTLVLAPVIEETFYRRFLFTELRKLFGFPVSMLASSFIFGIFHSNILISGFFGAYFAYVYEREHSLPVNIVLHFSLNLFTLLIMAFLSTSTIISSF